MGRSWFSRAVEQLRLWGASMDGSALDDQTWGSRHARITLLAAGLALFDVIFTLADAENRREQWIYTGIAVLFTLAGWRGARSRRAREACVAVAFASAQMYVTRFVGNFTLGPLLILVMSFYQDWMPIALGCVFAIAIVIVAWLDPAYYNGTRGLEREVALTGIGLRSAAMLVAAALALAIWRAGTQLGRDQLSGLSSRASAERALERELRRARRPVAWVCDLDNFSEVNRRLGSDVGDQLLKHVSARLRRLARAQSGSWFCARLGGDTFLIASRHEPDDEFIAAFALRIEEEIGAATIGGGAHEVPVRVSVGVAGTADRGVDLVRTAEHNMRAAKGRGLVRVVIDREAEPERAQATQLLSAELNRACEQDELELYLQPIVRLADEAPVGAEALVRWNHPDRGLVGPDQFLPEIERDSGLMALVSMHLGRQYVAIVADLIHRHGVGWLSYGYSYNLAAVRLRDPTLPDEIAVGLIRAGLADTKGLLHLEVTEGALMDIEHGAPEVLAQMRAHGYQISLDDFGTGHSSLAHLRDFPLDTVKIDKSFVWSMDRSPTDRAVVQAIADIASASGVKVVAEGVETAEQREFLLNIKPDILAQGWLYAPAMPVAQFEAWVLDRKRAPVV